MRRLLVLMLLLPMLAFADAQLSQKEYKVLTQAGELIENQQLGEAHKLLSGAKKDARDGYGKALMLHNLGQIELLRERYPRALAYLKGAYDQSAMPEESQLNLMRTLAQLHCMNDHWLRCAELLGGWMAKDPTAVKGDDYLLQAQAYSQLERWRSVVQPISAAIASRKIAPENWYQLKVLAHIQLKQWRSAVREQQRMMQFYSDKPDYWRQLVSLHQQNGDERSALAAQRIAYERNLLTTARDYRLLASMLLRAELPFYAAQVVEQGVERKILKSGKKNLELLSRSWILAKESERAVAVLADLNRVAPSKKTLVHMAYMQIELQDWNAAEKAIKRAMQRSQKPDPRLQLMMGITQIKLRDFSEARESLNAAATDRKVQSEAEGWIRYLDQIQPPDLLLSAN